MLFVALNHPLCSLEVQTNQERSKSTADSLLSRRLDGYTIHRSRRSVVLRPGNLEMGPEFKYTDVSGYFVEIALLVKSVEAVAEPCGSITESQSPGRSPEAVNRTLSLGDDSMAWAAASKHVVVMGHVFRRILREPRHPP